MGEIARRAVRGAVGLVAVALVAVALVAVALVAVALVALGPAAVPAGAAPALPVDAPVPPPPDARALAALDPEPHPLPGVRSRVPCVRSTGDGVIPGAPWSQQRLRFTDAWRFTRGAGQTVAVIDTGVSPHPRLAGRLVDGGDFVGHDGGLLDCDGHGTLVAGIVAATSDPATGFVGVAPDARVLSIRQSSLTVSTTSPDGTTGTGGGNVDTLAEAIVRATRLGATVINVSEAACVPAASAGPALAPLRAAVRAAVDADVVVVAAAGNVGSGACTQGADGQGAGQVVAPAWFGDDVLSVGYTRRDGLPSPLSLRGPWVSLSAPGSEIVSLDPAGPGVVDTVAPIGAERSVPIEGTSFAAPYVSGVVALVRARYPGLDARQVMARVTASADRPGGAPASGGAHDDAVGAGTVDPVAAVADVRPDEFTGDGPASVSPAGAGRVDLSDGRDAHSGSRTVALAGSAAAMALLGGTGLIVLVARRARRSR
ncbi:type VII secretion-associated serine protease mycosin [Actinomycetospora callitridis]|uniref:type VII secretion-associated serine protease mycosin n=1 Tax=Actinomycetospora callitridis TaxID=913944 RepID=UPI002366BB0D|nr:type VII secretion-associated serine protease mycosin [Actinomycetospora callitridis]MDD7918146.1 type VII secretion-associated serine protease mycosin [Actinomycetospora callitridis]